MTALTYIVALLDLLLGAHFIHEFVYSQRIGSFYGPGGSAAWLGILGFSIYCLLRPVPVRVVQVAYGINALLSVLFVAMLPMTLFASRTTPSYEIAVISLIAAALLGNTFVLRSRQKLVVPDNQPLHPTPSAGETPASGSGERRRYTSRR